MAKPKFDASKPFTVAQNDQGSKPKFDPNQSFDAVDDVENNEILEAALRVGNAIDSYTGAPTRAAIGALQHDQGLEGAAKAFGQQFGESPELAPTGQQIARKAGVPDTPLSEVMPGMFTEDDAEADQWLKFKKSGAADVTASGAAGLGVDILADPTNVIPVGALARGTTKAIGAGAKVTAKGGVALAKGTGNLAKKIPGVATAAEKTGAMINITKDGARNTADALKTMFTPSQADDYNDLLKIAQENGIDPKMLPESVEFGQDSFISRAARNRAEGVLGEPHLKKFHAGLDAVRDATEAKIAKIGGGSVPSTVEAGEMIRKGFDDGVDNFFNQVGMTHNKVMQAIPNLSLSPQGMQKIASKLDGIEKWAKGRATRGFTNAQRTQAEQVLRAVEAVKAGNGSYKQTVEALRDIGEVAFKTQNILADIPPDIAKFRDLYGTVNEALIDTVRQTAGAPVADELLQSNKAISEFLGDKSVISSIVGNKNMSPEKVFASLVEQGDTRKIEALKKILPPETFRQLKGSFLASQIRKNADDSFSFKGFHNNLRNKKNVLGSLLDANEIQELNDVIRLGNRFGEPVLSTSGTGASSLLSNITSGIRSGLESDTVIGVLKDSARNRSQKAIEATRKATQIPAKTGTPPLPPAASAIRKNLQNIARVSPIAARVIALHTGKDGQEPKGESKWAVNGYSNLLSHDKSIATLDEKSIQTLFSDKRAKQLLILASDLKPGSPAMEKLMNKIRALKGGA